MGSSWGRIAATAVVLLVTAGVAGATVVPAVALFDAPAQFGLGTGPDRGLFPVAIAAGDVSGDGIADLVTANRGSGNVSVLAGDGSGRFLPALSYTTGKGTSDVTVGDLNGDRKLDVAVANRGENTVSLFGNGAPLSQPPGLTGLKGPSAVAIGDFNADENADVAVANSNDNTVSVFLGLGGGLFGSTADTVTAVGLDPESLATGDFDRNGTLDLAVANRDGSDLSILSGVGGGAFTVQSVPLGDAPRPLQPSAVAAADLNGDGHPDLVASMRALQTPLANSVAVLLWNNGFPTVDHYGKTSPHPSSVAIADLNADGYQDVAIGSGDSAQASILWATGAGVFDPKGPKLLAAGRAPIGVAAYDLNDDLKPDLAFADSFLDGVAVVSGDGTKVMQQMAYVDTKGSQPVAVAVANLNGDLILDAVSANSNASSVSVLLGEAAPDRGHFAFTQLLAVASTPNDVQIGDLDGDNKPDLGTANRLGNSVSLWKGVGDGSFTDWTPSRDIGVGSSPHAVAIADLNGDNRRDLVTANMKSDDVTVLLNNGNGTFTASSFSAGPAGSHPVSVAVAELTGDGLPDVAVADYGDFDVAKPPKPPKMGKVVVLVGSGNGRLDGGLRSYDVGVHPTAVTAKDVNGDLRADLVVTNRGSDAKLADSVSVLLADDGDLQSPISSPVGVGYKPVAVDVGDLNRDGFPDLAVALSGGTDGSDFCKARGGPSGGVALLYGDGSGLFTPAGSYASLNDACDVALGDLNGDNRLDVTVPAARTRVVESYLNETP